MNIAKPIGSEIRSVDFLILEDDEVRALSVKQISNPQVFDNLGHPVANGLYDLGLGAFLRHNCATCGLDERNGCPGHQGHIELPVPVYHPLFFPHMYVFLRGSCVFCHKFKLGRTEANLFECKLRLLQYGLLVECDKLEEIRVEDIAEDDEDDQGEDDDQSGLVAERNMFVDQCIKNLSKAYVKGPPTGLILESRKNIVKQVYLKLVSKPKCANCKMFSPAYRKDGFSKLFEKPLTDKQIQNNRIKALDRTDGGAPNQHLGTKYILLSEVKGIINSVFHNERQLIAVLFSSRPSRKVVTGDLFFRSTLVVPPTRFRLPSKLGDEVHENSLNELLLKVLGTVMQIKTTNGEIVAAKAKESVVTVETKKGLFNRLMNAFVTLQNDVNAFVDLTKAQNQGGKLPTPGVKQALEKKEGLFRKHMMGKRVNYAARSVISPDPMLETNEVGVPPVFAMKLSFPEPVTAHNVNQLRKAVINGPDKWPGALQIQNEDGSLVSLVGMLAEQRTALAAQLLTPGVGSLAKVGLKKVLRHLKNGDMVLMNRQPTLHKASIMGHRVRVLPGEKTLRIHYANTGAYNADFDGDEMNMHFPQLEMAQAEARFIALTDSQYLTPTAGAPVRGLIQDHISAGVWFTSQDAFFTRTEMQNYVYSCMRPEDGHVTSGSLKTPAPAVVKPQALWTGKQLISTILMNIVPERMPGLNFQGKNKIKNEYWGPESKENTVLFHNGELVCGILDKSQYGASKYGFVHAVHEVYGPEAAGKLLSVLGRLFTSYNQNCGFTCGMEDIYITEEGNAKRRLILDNAGDVGRDAAAEVCQLDSTEEFTAEFRKRLEEIIRDDQKLAILDAITQSKAEKVTLRVISTVIPKYTGKKFPYNAMQLMALSGAKGSAVNVSQIMCLLGQQSLEGRRVPLMVSGKSLPCFKALETDARAGGYIKNRFYSGIRPQEYYFHCMAGREGLIDTAVKTARSGYLQRCLIKQLEGIHIGYDNSVRDSDGTVIQFLYGGDSLDPVKESYLRQFEFCYNNAEGLKSRYDPVSVAGLLDIEAVNKYNKKVKKYVKKAEKKHEPVDVDAKYLPVISKYNPGKYVGSVSSTFEADLRQYLEQHQEAASFSNATFEALMQLKYMRSLVSPGESVGIIAAQSIGEPSTQMTLNTFHFAGHGAANVTLGIPRLREIVMTASSDIKTPQMYLPILEHVSDDTAETFCKSATRIKFSELVDVVHVVEQTDEDSRGYAVRVNFFPRKEYKQEYNVDQGELELCASTVFLQVLEKNIRKELANQRRSGQTIGVAVPKEKLREPVEEGLEGEEEREVSKTKQSVSYDEPDEEEAEIIEAEKSDEEERDQSDDDSDEEMAVSQDTRDRENQIISSHNYIAKFNFDDAKGQWCEFSLRLPFSSQKLLMVDLIEETCRAVVVRETKNIGRCIYPKADIGQARSLTTEGVNFKAMFEEIDIVDVNGITSNDVAAVLKTYGVEAARETVVREISKVFGTYAISVSSRHLDLIADFMTREGSYLAFNRQGIDSSTSAFKKMSYETTCQFLTKAVLDNTREELDSPSAKLVVGNLAGVGTGSFDVLTKLNFA